MNTSDIVEKLGSGENIFMGIGFTPQTLKQGILAPSLRERLLPSLRDTSLFPPLRG